MDLKYINAKKEDADLLIKIYNTSFYNDYIKYGECPGYNHTRESMTNTILSRIVYKIICDDKIIGNISIRDNKDDTYHLCCLCVIPEYQNKRIGQKALRFIESKYSNATTWTLETPADKEKNHHFYIKFGYNIVKEYMDGSVKLVLFEKQLSKSLL